MTLEPIPVVPNPAPNRIIETYQRGGYDPYVTDSEGRQRNAVEFFAELLSDLDASGTVIARFNVQNGYGPVFASSPVELEWFSNYPGESNVVLQSLPLPSISDLGIDTDKYQVFAKTMFVCQDALDTNSVVETRLLHMGPLGDWNVVSGSEASDTLTNGSKDQLIQSDWFETPTNGAFMIDFRTPEHANANGVQARRQAIMVRIVRR